MRILLVTDMPPCRLYTGGIVLDSLCALLPKGAVACFAATSAQLSIPSVPLLEDALYERADRPRDDWGTLRRFGGLASLVMETTACPWQESALVARAVDLGRRFGADRVWCVLEGQTMIRMARAVAAALRVPLRTSVWDPPGWWLRQFRIHPLVRRRLLAEFDRAVATSECCGTASWAMAERYADRYGVRTVPLVPGLPSALARPPAAGVRRDGTWVIALAGQIYSLTEWSVLLRALNGCKWSLRGRPVQVAVLSRQMSLLVDGPADIRLMGWRSQEDTLRILAEADVLYCPYWFDPAFEEEARLSFPSKLTSYLAAGRAVLFHGPEYASPSRFLVEHDAGLCCHSLDPVAVTESLCRLFGDADLYRRLTAHGRRAFDEHLTMDCLRKSFLDFAGANDTQS